jgi:hypothetical protein
MSVDLAWGARYAEFWWEAEPLAREHWKEVGTHNDILDFDPDHERYVALENIGMLHILTARDEGVLVGYFFVGILRHPHDRKCLIGTDMLVYCRPQYRRELLGPLMYDAAEKKLEELGAHIVMFRKKAHWNGDGFLTRRGYGPQETIYDKVLRRP